MNVFTTRGFWPAYVGIGIVTVLFSKLALGAFAGFAGPIAALAVALLCVFVWPILWFLGLLGCLVWLAYAIGNWLIH